jgi:DNA (cytosine-5)-methyltransferase 1
MSQVLSAFSGAGGDSLGLERAGFEVSVAIDWDKDCCATYRNNFPDADVYKHDVKNISLVRGDVDGVFIGISAGTPCQGSSRLNYRKVGTDRNDLVFEVVRLGVESGAEWILIENVPTFLMKEDLLRAGREAGYNMFATVLNSSDYGVPQMRRRWFCLGLRSKDTFIWPAPSEHAVTVRQAHAMVEHHWGTAKRRPDTLERMKVLDQNPCVWMAISSGTFENGIAWEWDRPAPALVHTEKVYQKLVGEESTISQALASIIQGFPPEFRFSGAKRSVGQQITNACPPQLSEAIGRAIQERYS